MMHPAKRLAAGLFSWTVSSILLGLSGAHAADHALWNVLLERHVRWIDQGHASVVDYAGMAHDRVLLKKYLSTLSSVDSAAFDRWPKEEQLAFLINAYNAFTVQLVLTRYPQLDSIKDLGSLLQSPWRKRFVPLLGQKRSLDDLEHGLIRGSGRYREPRVHFALNCASIGCPALRPEAYHAAGLAAQLEDQARRFLGDRSRNHFADGRLVLSPIFKWYREDFEADGQPLHAYLARYAHELGLNEAQAQALAAGRIPITFGDYDWRLNDSKRGGP